MDHGLTEYQARVYLTLLDLGSAAASQIPPLSRVPRTRIYSTMQQLHAKGLVEILPESPLPYQAVPFAAYPRALARHLRARGGQIGWSLEGLSREFAILAQESPEGRGRFEAIYGRRNARDRLVHMYDGAEADIVAIGTPRSPGRVLRAVGASLAQKAREGVALKYAFRITPENRGDVATLLRHAEVRDIGFPMPVYMHVVDGREFLMSHPIPAADSFTKGADIAIWTDAPAIARAMSQIAIRIWETGTPAPPDLVAEAHGSRKTVTTPGS